MIARLEKRMKKRDALDVVPMIVRHQDVSVDAIVAAQIRPTIAQHSQAGAAVEDEPRAIRRGEFQTGRVSPVAPGIALQRRRRAAHSPEDQLGSMVRHRWANRDA